MKRLPRPLVIAIVCLLLIIPLALFMIKQTAQPPSQEVLAQQEYNKAKKQADILGETVAKQTDVPKDETPNVATITDVTQLQNQEFFKQAKNGDKILIYEKKKIIVLYRPNEDKVIATAPVLYNQKSASDSAAPPAADSSLPQITL